MYREITVNPEQNNKDGPIDRPCCSDPERIRTSNQQNRNLSFYPVELRGRNPELGGLGAAKIVFAHKVH